MDLRLNYSLAMGYKSATQIARVVTEGWVAENVFCPICGEPMLRKYDNNKPVADFCCPSCQSDFELKSKKSVRGTFGKKVNDGAYDTMIKRIMSLHNPNFFFMTHNDGVVSNLLLVPNYFFVPQIIEKRKRLSDEAERHGWQGCNILLGEIPQSGKIFLVKDAKEVDKCKVLDNVARCQELRTDNLASRGWMMDVLSCVDRIPEDAFTLQQVYAFTEELQQKYPDNHFVKDKIRQQLQLLRDKGFIEFTSRGNYRKIELG